MMGISFLSIFSTCLFSILFPLYVQAEENTWRDTLKSLLPIESRLQGWKMDSPPDTAKGLELFQLINGGAEIYIQAGFESAILVSYRNKKGKTINLEIFEMTSNESARNVHEKKISNEGKKLPIGDAALLEGYYINFRKARFQVTLSGDDSEEETVKALLNMARLVAEKIQSSP
jgi:hypothetical protein